jgi:hypothetical protein
VDKSATMGRNIYHRVPWELMIYLQVFRRHRGITDSLYCVFQAAKRVNCKKTQDFVLQSLFPDRSYSRNSPGKEGNAIYMYIYISIPLES